MLALLPLALSLVPELAKWIGGDRAGPVATQAVDVVRSVLGTDDPAEAAAVLVDPEKAATLRVRLAEIAASREEARDKSLLDEMTARFADVAGARSQTIALTQAGSRMAWAAPVVSVVVTIGFLGVLFLMLRSGDGAVWHPTQAAILNIMVGGLGAGFTQVLNYWLGSSAGSARNAEAVRALATGQGQPAAIATTAPVTVNPPAPSPPGRTFEDLNARSLADARGAR